MDEVPRQGNRLGREQATGNEIQAYTKSSVTLCSPDGSDLYSTTPSTSTIHPVTTSACVRVASRPFHSTHRPRQNASRRSHICINQTVSHSAVPHKIRLKLDLPGPDIEADREQRRNARRRLECSSSGQVKPQSVSALSIGSHCYKMREIRSFQTPSGGNGGGCWPGDVG